MKIKRIRTSYPILRKVKVQGIFGAKKMRINYKEFAEGFSKSGLSMKAYGDQRGMSPSMVSYYLKCARQSRSSIKKVFSEIQIVSNASKSKSIKISTSAGVQIEIPL